MPRAVLWPDIDRLPISTARRHPSSNASIMHAAQHHPVDSEKFRQIQNSLSHLIGSLTTIADWYKARNTFQAHGCRGLYSGPTSSAYLRGPRTSRAVFWPVNHRQSVFAARRLSGFERNPGRHLSSSQYRPIANREPIHPQFGKEVMQRRCLVRCGELNEDFDCDLRVNNPGIVNSC